MAKKRRFRMVLEMDQNVANGLERLTKETNAGERVEVIRRSLAVFDYLSGLRSSGAKFVVLNPDGTTFEPAFEW